MTGRMDTSDQDWMWPFTSLGAARAATTWTTIDGEVATRGPEMKRPERAETKRHMYYFELIDFPYCLMSYY